MKKVQAREVCWWWRIRVADVLRAEEGIRVRGFQGPSQTLFARGPRRVLRQQEGMELLLSRERDVLSWEMRRSLEVLVGW